MFVYKVKHLDASPLLLWAEVLVCLPLPTSRFDPRLSYKRTRHDIVQSVSSSRHPHPDKLSVVHYYTLVVACVIVDMVFKYSCCKEMLFK